VTHTISSASALRKCPDARKFFAANKAVRDTALPGAAPTSKSTAAAATTSASGVSTLNKLSGGSRLVAPRDELVTARLEFKLASEVQVLNQASKNAGQVSSILQTAAAVQRIDAKLDRMAELADEAAGYSVSDSQRAVLNNEFADLRAEVDDIAGVAKFSNSALLDGANNFTATSIGGNIEVADGFQAITFDSRAGDGFAASGNSIAINYDSSTNIFTVTNLATGRSAVSEAVSAAPAEGETRDVIIADFGLTLQLNSSFSTAGNITANNSFQVSGSANNQVDLGLRIGSGIASGSDEISANLQRVRIATLSSELQHDDILSIAGAVNSAANVKSAQEALQQFQTSLDANLTRVGIAVANLENGIANFESASANLSDLAAAAQAIQGALHDVVAETAGAILAKVNQVPDILAQLQSLEGFLPSAAPAPSASAAAVASPKPAPKTGTAEPDSTPFETDET
jgi:flagellin